PASYFHLLRRQGRDPVEKPLVVMTPKSLLRHPRCVSSLPELADGRFLEVLDDPRSEEHTSELQSRFDLVCRLLLEKKKKNKTIHISCLSTSHKRKLHSPQHFYNKQHLIHYLQIPSTQPTSHREEINAICYDSLQID